MRHENFAVFILSHGRADRVYTYTALRSHGYTGRVVLIVDNEDDQVEEYRKNFPEVYVFDKSAYAGVCDFGDADGSRNVVLPARNACHDIARALGLTYFLELDDDYQAFGHRYIADGGLRYLRADLEPVFDAFLDFLDESGAITVAFSQGGDLIGGKASKLWRQRIVRKVMNSFFCRTDRPFKFYGRLNEDTTMYTLLGSQGKLMFTATRLQLVQKLTQRNSGGLTEAYLAMGTYRKSFYSVMWMPSAVRVAAMGVKDFRLHHRIDWDRCLPKILNEKWRRVPADD